MTQLASETQAKLEAELVMARVDKESTVEALRGKLEVLVRQGLVALEKGGGVLRHFLERLAVDVARDALQVGAPVLLEAAHEVVEVLARPAGEAALEQLRAMSKEQFAVEYLNIASAEQLMGLKEVGTVRAKAIVEKRKISPFKKPEDLASVHEFGGEGLRKKHVLASIYALKP